MAEPTTAATPAPASPPTKIWQYLILYPTLALSIGGSIPTVWNELKAIRLGVARSELQLAQEQEKLWRSNLDCIQQQGIYEADGVDGLIVKVTLCPSGDVLLRYYSNDWTPQFKWVGRPKPPRKAPA
jgi:hypothetical protein